MSSLVYLFNISKRFFGVSFLNFEIKDRFFGVKGSQFQKLKFQFCFAAQYVRTIINTIIVINCTLSSRLVGIIIYVFRTKPPQQRRRRGYGSVPQPVKPASNESE